MAVALDAVTTQDETGSTTWTHTPVGVPTAVAVFITKNSLLGPVSGFTYGGFSMTLVNSGGAGDAQTNLYIFALANPPPGPQSVVGSIVGARWTAASVTVTGSDLVTVFRDTQFLGTAGAPPDTITLASAAGDLCVDYIIEIGSTATMTPGPPNSTIFGPITDTSGTLTYQGSDAPASGPTTMTWAFTNGNLIGLFGGAFKSGPSGAPLLPGWVESEW